MKLQLDFISGVNPGLYRVEFERRPGSKRISVRGKGAKFDEGFGSFQWTSAVKALCELAVATRLELLSPSKSHNFVIEGVEGSPAAALDSAISKPTSWIIDVFGKESSGNNSVLSVLRRENAERKLPGPVRIGFAPALRDGESIVIRLDGAALQSQEDLQSLLASLREEHRSNSANQRSNGLKSLEQYLELRLGNDAFQSLCETELLEPMGVESAVGEAKNVIPGLASFPKLAEDLLSSIPKLSDRYRGIETSDVDLLSSASSPLIIDAPTTATTALLLLRFVVSRLKIPLVINTNFPSTTAIAESEIQNRSRADLAILSWGAVASLDQNVSDHGFKPVMLLPRTCLELLGVEDESKITEILAAGDPTGYPRRYFDILRERDARVTSTCKLKNASFAEIMNTEARPGSAAIMAAPFSAIAEYCLGFDRLRADSAEFRFADNILLARDSLERSKLNAIARLIRAVWYEMLESEELRSSMTSELIEVPEYRNFLKRLAGQVLYGADNSKINSEKK